MKDGASWLKGLLFVALLIAAQASTAATVIVTQTDDVPPGETPIFGSLRDAIRNRASAGDTIVFQVRGPVRLLDDLVIPRELYGLTLQGRAVIRVEKAQAGSIQIEADDTTVNDITFMNVSVFAGDVRGGLPRRVQRFTLAGSRFQGGAQVSISDADDCRVTGNQFNVRPQSGNDEALTTSRTTRCVVSGNMIQAATGEAFLDEDSEDLQLTDNPKLQGDVWISAISGDIVGNVFNGALHVYRPDLGASYGHLRIEDNEARSMTVDRTFFSVIHNNLSGTTPGIRGPGAALYVQNQEPRGAQGPILIERNTTTGGRNGIQLTHYPTGGDVVIHDNDVFGCTERGVLVVSGHNVLITKNRIRQCGSAALGQGIAIGQAGSSGVVAEDNEVWEINGSGIVVAPQLPGREVLLKGNTVRDNLAPGITLLRNNDDLPGRTRMEGNILTKNAVAGVLAEVNARGSVSGGEIKNNPGAGVLVRAGAKVEVRQVGMGGNAAAGIDIEPAGVTPNPDVKTGNRDLDWPEDVSINATTRKLEGRSAPGSIVEIFTVEDGERAGNPLNGEGVTFLGSATAGPDGLFSFPSAATLECPATRLLTLTATLSDGSPVTSEFSPDFDCVLPDVPPVDDDDDNDGVNNATDQCANTPDGETVDANGCAESQKDDDGDGVNNTADQCPATPTGETADANGCAESQKDGDGDGVVDSQDKCPGPGTTAAQGCQQVIGIPGLGTFFINVAALSTIQSGQEGEGCSDCSVELDDGTSHSCFGDADVTISGPTAVSSTNCDYKAPALAIDGTGALVSSVINQGVSCEGDAGQCVTAATNPNLAGACGQASCIRFFSDSVARGISTDTTRAVVSKSTIGGDGTFLFSGRTDVLLTSQWVVSTAAGAGDKVAELHFGNSETLVVEEAPQTAWEESVLCTNPTSGGQQGGENSVTLSAVASEAFTTWQCEFVNTSIADTDGDGVPDSEDIYCPDVAGTNGNGCPAQGDNGFVAHYCNDPLNCTFGQSGGYCANCTLVRLDGTGSCFSDQGGGVCTTRDESVLECSSGGCRIDTANFSGQCDLGTSCTLASGYSCSSNTDGTGCAGTIASTGEAIACPHDGPCNIELTPSVIYRDANAAVKLDIFKQTVGGDGLFTFTWQAISRDPIFGAPFTSNGSFTIETVGSVGSEAARFYLDPSNGSDVVVKELTSPGFVLDRLECASSAGLDGVLVGGPELEGTGVAGRFQAFGENSCTFFNVMEGVDPDRVALLPDGHQAGEGVNGRIRPDAFGGQMSTTNPVVAVAAGTGQFILDTVTGEVPRAGNDRMSFLGFGSYDVLVKPDADRPGYDTILTAGPGSVAHTFDPSSGYFQTSVGFNNIVDLVHVGNDNTSPQLVSVDRTRNQIDVIDPSPETGVDFTYSFPLVRPENLQDAAGKVVSAQALELGPLNCGNPCEVNYSGIRRGCSAAIDQVLDTVTEAGDLSVCAQFWASTCIAAFQSQNEGYCDQPVEQQSYFGGAVLVVTDGTPGLAPGQVHMANPAASILDRVLTVGNVGDDPRRLRCLNGICAVSNYGSNTLTILTWDGGPNAAITVTVTVGDGPIGIDLRQVGENVVILSTGSRDNTFAVTTVSPFGEVVDNLIRPIPAGCEGPGHIAWIEGTAKAFATCGANDSYAIFTPQAPAPSPPP